MLSTLHRRASLMVLIAMALAASCTSVRDEFDLDYPEGYQP